MVVSESRIERLRTEADTIFTRIERVESALSEARSSDGDHWETGELTLDLRRPDGESIAVTLDIDDSAAENAQRRYERAAEMEATLERRREIAGPLAPLPTEPLAVTLLVHVADHETVTSRAAAAELDADHDRIRSLCVDLTDAGLFDRSPAADAADRFSLSADGRSVADHLDTREGTATLLELHDEMARLARRLHRGGPDYPTKTARDLGFSRAHVRELYQAMRAVGLVQPYEGSIIKGSERKLSPKDETHKKHTYYVTTTVADRILREE